MVVDALACVEDVPLAEMWSQGVFIDRRHGLAVVVLVLQSWISVVNLSGADPKLVRRKAAVILCALGSTYVLDSTYGLDSSYGDRWSGTYVRAQSAAADL